MKKIIMIMLFFPFFVIADEFENKLMDDLQKLAFQQGAVAASYCHNYYVFGDLLFELNKNGDPSNSIPKIREQFGNAFVDNTLNFKGNERKFLKDKFESCLKLTTETGKLQKPN